MSLDPGGHLIRWSRRAETVSGFSADELHGRLLSELIAPDDQHAFLGAVRQAIEGGYAEVESHLLCRDGSTRPYQWTAAPLRDGRGQIVGLTGVGRDITALKRGETVLRESRQQLQAILDASPSAHLPQGPRRSLSSGQPPVGRCPRSRPGGGARQDRISSSSRPRWPPPSAPTTCESWRTAGPSRSKRSLLIPTGRTLTCRSRSRSMPTTGRPTPSAGSPRISPRGSAPRSALRERGEVPPDRRDSRRGRLVVRHRIPAGALHQPGLRAGLGTACQSLYEATSIVPGRYPPRRPCPGRGRARERWSKAVCSWPSTGSCDQTARSAGSRTVRPGSADDAGRAYRIVGVARDITERRQAEDALAGEARRGSVS